MFVYQKLEKPETAFKFERTKRYLGHWTMDTVTEYSLSPCITGWQIDHFNSQQKLNSHSISREKIREQHFTIVHRNTLSHYTILSFNTR